MRFRKLRITWSVLWGLACVLLIVLWVRSYWWKDFAVSGGVRQIHLESCIGRLGVMISPQPPDLIESGWKFHSFFWAEDPVIPLGQFESVLWFKYEHWPEDTITVTLPYWFPIVVVFSLATVPLIHWRFRLRTLLIATTLVGVVLGLAVWLGR